MLIDLIAKLEIQASSSTQGGTMSNFVQLLLLIKWVINYNICFSLQKGIELLMKFHLY